MYILDTNVISELRRPTPHGAVVAWLESVEDASLYLSSVTVGEIQAGIELTREQDPDKASEIEHWLNALTDTWNILPMDCRTFGCWARLMHGHSDTLVEDAMITATAQIHGLVVVARNVNDFRPFGVSLLNPLRQQ